MFQSCAPQRINALPGEGHCHFSEPLHMACPTRLLRLPGGQPPPGAPAARWGGYRPGVRRRRFLGGPVRR
eukprot:9709839-Alexandrium_andersonii.AAC.1